MTVESPYNVYRRIVDELNQPKDVSSFDIQTGIIVKDGVKRIKKTLLNTAHNVGVLAYNRAIQIAIMEDTVLSHLQHTNPMSLYEEWWKNGES